MRFNTLIILILLFSITAYSCSGKKSPNINTDTVSASPTENESDINVNNDNFSGSGDRIKKVDTGNRDKKTVQPVQNFVNTDENHMNHYYLLSELSLKEAVFPEDFEIGELFTGQKDLKSASDLIIMFFDELKIKKVNKDIIDEEKRFYLGKIFDEYVKNNYIPETVRIGVPLIKDDKIYVNLRFIKKTGKTEGMISIIKKKNKLFIDGFKGDLSLLDSETSQSDVRFEPEIYKFQ